MSTSSFISADDLLLDERFLAWARGELDNPGFQWVEDLRQASDQQEMEVFEAYTLYQRLVLPESLPDNEQEQRLLLMRRVERETPLIIPAPKKNQSIQTVAVLVMALTIMSGVLYFFYQNKVSTQSLTGDGKESVLEDGTRVRLTAQSTIRFDKGFSMKKAREVWVKGEAEFKVRHTQDEKPFLVHTPAFVIQVTGTRFIVTNSEERVSVLLQEGSVNLKFQTGEIVQMKPGDYFAIEGQSVIKPDEVPAPAQLERHIVFDNTPISQVIQEIESRYQVRVEIQSPELKDKLITGILPNDNLRILLHALEVAMDCEIKQNQQTIYIKSSN